MFPGVEVLEIFRLEREGYAAQENVELSLYAPQQPQTEICPKCGGEVLVNKPTGNAFCIGCDYRRSGKLSVVR